MSSEFGLISIIMPAYNTEKTIISIAIEPIFRMKKVVYILTSMMKKEG